MAKSLASLVPTIEQRECAWAELQERLARRHEASPLPSITISREFGCEGYPLAQHLKGLLEEVTGLRWTIYDRALVEQVAADERLSRDLLSHLGDESHAQDVLLTQFGLLTHQEAFAKVARHLLQIATAGCAILVGRGGAVICRDLRSCFHFRLVGSFAFRCASLARRLDLSREEAEAMVHQQSRLRERFISECLHEDVTAAQWYDAVFNNERQPIELIAQACLRILELGWPERSGLRGFPLGPALAPGGTPLRP